MPPKQRTTRAGGNSVTVGLTGLRHGGQLDCPFSTTRYAPSTALPTWVINVQVQMESFILNSLPARLYYN